MRRQLRERREDGQRRRQRSPRCPWHRGHGERGARPSYAGQWKIAGRAPCYRLSWKAGPSLRPPCVDNRDVPRRRPGARLHRSAIAWTGWGDEREGNRIKRRRSVGAGQTETYDSEEATSKYTASRVGLRCERLDGFGHRRAAATCPGRGRPFPNEDGRAWSGCSECSQRSNSRTW